MAVRAIVDGSGGGWVFRGRQRDVDMYLKADPGSTVQTTKGEFVHGACC